MYYCRFADLVTDQDICELSIPFTLDRRIILPGTFSTTINISNSIVGSSVKKIIPQKTICHVYRNDLIIGSYIVWAKKYKSNRGKISADIQGATLESYLYHRILQSDLIFTDVDQFEIADDLLTASQDFLAPYFTYDGNIGITSIFIDSVTTGVLRNREYYTTDAKYIGDLLENLANVDNGFEYIIHVYSDTDSDRPREFQIQYPKLTGSESTFIMEEPGDILDWEILYDGTQGATVFYARGQTGAADPGDDQVPILTDPAVATEYLDNGWPILQYVSDYQNATEVETLNGYAAWWAQNRSGPVVIPAFKVRADSLFSHGFSSFSIGSNFIVIMNNPLFPLSDSGVPSFSYEGRMIGFQLKIDEKEVEEMDILVETQFDPTDIQ